MYNERILDHKKREVFIVELKAPRVKISPKEIGQVMKYTREIEKVGSLTNNINYKILLISTDINSDAQFDLTGRQKTEDNPYFYFRNDKRNIEIWIMKWSDLIENVKRKLKYMSAILEVKDIDVQDKASKDFADIDFGRISSTLKKVSV